MGQMKLVDPMIVGRSDSLYLLASGDVSTNRLTDAQTWEPSSGYSEVLPLQVWLKFLYYLDNVIPPEPWIEPT